MESQILKEGYLKLEIAQSNFSKQWKKIWVVLEGSSLLCYNNNTKTELTESFDLSQYDSLEIVSSVANQYQFELRSMSLWEFRLFEACNEAELNQWTKHILNTRWENNTIEESEETTTLETQENNKNENEYKRKIINKSVDIIISGYCREFIDVSNISNINILDLCCLYFNVKKILFLDIDGVLNNLSSRPKTLNPDLLLLLKMIINLTQCNIVLSSSWRRVDDLKNLFKKEFNKITGLDIDNSIYIGDTPCNGRNPTRVHEIMEYFDIMEENEQIKHSNINWVVVDDMNLLNENGMGLPISYKSIVQGHWVQTNIETGLTQQNVERIVSILNDK